MGLLTNRDASQITTRNRNLALFSYASAFRTAVTTANPNPALIAPAVTSAEVVSQIGLGNTACILYNNSLSNVNPDPNTQLYPFNPSSGY